MWLYMEKRMIKMVKVNFDPRLRMENKIRDKTKKQTTREKPWKIGKTYNLWATWRGQKRGLYCEKCWRIYPCQCTEKSFSSGVQYPRKIMDAICSEVIPIKMSLRGKNNAGLEVPDSILIEYEGKKEIIWNDKNNQTDFSQKDGFCNNQECFNFFAPKLPKDGKPMEWYINKWREKYVRG